ncbi:MAG: maleylpyruvate isomerase N-terminal domain-containing protein [Chitinophagales bacterium]|nr:maleylpyruvate isomerase N-terminal domain-containing protein [Chitinophagales bacterium]
MIINIPIPTTHLFPILDQQLIELLQSLSKEDWCKPTIAKKWQVKDIAAHLLDGNIRTLSLSRDKHQLQPGKPINSYEELVNYLNELNATWVQASKRMSPELLTELLASTGQQFCGYIASLDPFGDAIFSVAWAGEAVSKNWFHVAREYTEKFIHQQQIRDAVGKPGLFSRELFYPFIDTFMCGLPHTYRNVPAADGTVICVHVTTDAGGNWYLTRSNDHWHLAKETDKDIAAAVIIDPDTAWKLFSKGITAAEARANVQLTGDITLGTVALQMVSVMA